MSGERGGRHPPRSLWTTVGPAAADTAGARPDRDGREAVANAPVSIARQARLILGPGQRARGRGGRNIGLRTIAVLRVAPRESTPRTQLRREPGRGEWPARLHQPPAMSPRAVPQRGGEAPWAGVGAWRLRLEPQGKCCWTCCADGLPRSRESRGGWTACGNGHAPGEPHWTSLSGVCLLLRGCARCVLAAGAEGASGVCGLPGVRRSRPARRAAGEPSLRSQRPCQGP